MDDIYNFDEVIDRRNTNSYKWNVDDGELPMWVADMDFRTAPCIIDALRDRVEHGVFGYADIPNAWYDAYIHWWKTYHNLEIDKEWLVFTTGVIPTISTTVRKFTTPAEKVVVMTPVYNVFFYSIVNNGRVVLESPLRYNGYGYEIDYGDLENKLSDPQATLLILCNPHNPIGKIWSREELIRIGELCKKHGVLVLSDEIHCDLTAPGTEYVPFASASDVCKDISITAISPTKAFNIAGLHSAAVFCSDDAIRNRIIRALNTDEVAEPNSFAIDAAIAAFTKGRDYLIALREYIYDNKSIATAYINEHLPQVNVIEQDATYLMWLDASHYSNNSNKLAVYIRQKTGLFLSSGAIYRGNGDSFLRLNVACPKSTLIDGLDRLKRALTQ